MSHEIRRGLLPEQAIAPFRRLESRFNVFVDRRVARETSKLFNVIDKRAVNPTDRTYLMGIAKLAYIHHLGEKRVTGGPYIRHPYAVAERVAKNPHIPNEEIRDHVAMALGHDLPENTHITSLEIMNEFQHAVVIKGVRLLSKFNKAEGGKKQSKEDNFREILDSGDIKTMRVKIADWDHNLETTPSSTDGYRGKKRTKVIKFQKKFFETSKFILPLIRFLPNEEEQKYLYEQIKNTFYAHKPPDAPDLEPLALAA